MENIKKEKSLQNRTEGETYASQRDFGLKMLSFPLATDKFLQKLYEPKLLINVCN